MSIFGFKAVGRRINLIAIDIRKKFFRLGFGILDEVEFEVASGPSKLTDCVVAKALENSKIGGSRRGLETPVGSFLLVKGQSGISITPWRSSIVIFMNKWHKGLNDIMAEVLKDGNLTVGVKALEFSAPVDARDDVIKKDKISFLEIRTG